MPYCSKCGALVPESAGFCQKCGLAQPVSTAATEQSSLSPNTAALLSYVLGWLTGLIFFLIDKRPYVRFHAAQSIITFGGLHIVRAVLGLIFGVGLWFGHKGRMWPGWPILSLLGIVSFVLWIVLMVKAHQGQKYKLPIVGDLAENWAGR